MKKLLSLALLAGTTLWAQSVDTAIFRAVMSTGNEVPPTSVNASGIATIRVHFMRDATGKVATGTVDFNISYLFDPGDSFTGLHIHRGAAGTNGPVVIGTDVGGVGGQIPIDASGKGTIFKQVQVDGKSDTSLSAMRDLLDDPSGFYVNLHTTANPGGVIRGQLQRPQMVTLMGLMQPSNEVPAIDSQAVGYGTVIAMRTFDAAGKLTSGAVQFECDFDMKAATTVTGFHIHTAPAGVNGSVTIDTATSGLATSSTGTGTVVKTVEIDLNRQPSVDALNGLFTDPAGYYINMHTTERPGGLIRSQLRQAETVKFYAMMSSDNEVPAIEGLNARAGTLLTVNLLRNPDGSPLFGRIEFDANYRFPDAVTLQAMHIHNGVEGQNGPVIIDSVFGTPVVSDTGFGNVTRRNTISSTAALATLSSLLASPENQYVNLHSSANPGGAVRAAMGTILPGPPIVDDVTSLAETGQRTFAPGSLVSIYGILMGRTPGDLTGWQGAKAPSSLNGTDVMVGGKSAALLAVSGGEVDVQIPADVATGAQQLMVTHAGQTSAPFSIRVAATSPSVFTNGTAALVYRSADGSFITNDNPAKSGDTLWLFSTGLGPTTPALGTGEVAGQTNRTATVSLTIGGRAAEVVSSQAWPGTIGVYQTVFRVPANVPAGRQPLVLTVGSGNSNPVQVPIAQ